MHPIKTNILITNTMRSGSSYLSRILSAHSKISMTYDTFNFFRFCHKKYDPIENFENFEQLIKDFAFRLKNRFELNIDVDECLKFASDQPTSYQLAYNILLRQIYPDPKKTILGDQESLIWTRVPKFLEYFPNGKVIIIARDPRDVVNSFKKITIAPADDYLIALFNAIDIVDHGLALSKSRSKNVHFLTFENLKTKPIQEVEKLCNFIGIEFEDQMLDSSYYTDHSGNSWDDIKSRSVPEESDPLAAVGRWKKNIDPVDLCLAEWLAKDQIKHMGLELSGVSFSQEVFDEAVKRITSSPLIREAFYKLMLLNEGSEKFPLDPTNPKNWDPNGVKNKAAFSN